MSGTQVDAVPGARDEYLTGENGIWWNSSSQVGIAQLGADGGHGGVHVWDALSLLSTFADHVRSVVDQLGCHCGGRGVRNDVVWKEGS